MNYISTFFSLLKDRHSFLKEIHEGDRLKSKISALMLCSFCCFAVYGLIIGSFHSWEQALSSAIKLPALYLITLTVCLPALHIFNSLFGSRKSIAQHFTYILSAASVIALLLAGFAPIVLFFITTLNPAKDYSFYLLMNVAVFMTTGIFGVSFLYQAMRPASEADGDENVKVRDQILRLWLVLYGFVGSQLGWTLRPFFGSSEAFVLFRPREGNFLSGVWIAFRHVLGL
jgi:glucan phosphoethanolaminetransferase (alkaline phosphatase superfamily)